MNRIFAALFIAGSLAAQTQDSNVRKLGPVVFANLGTPADGTITYCSDCTQANPTASGGSGAFVRRENGAWNGGGGAGAVSSVFSRTGAVTAQTGDYTAAQVTNAFDVTANNALGAHAETFTDIATPANPSAGTTKIYSKGGLVCSLNSSGSENCTGSGGGAVSSVFTRTGAVTAQTGDYTAAQVTNAFDLTANNNLGAHSQTLTDIATPSAPSSGATKIYSKGGKICSLDPSSSENCTGGTGSGVTTPTFLPITILNQTSGTGTEISGNVATAPGPGHYLLVWHASLNTACTTGSNSVLFTYGWTGTNGSRQRTTGNLALGSQTNGSYLADSLELYIASGNVTYASTTTGTCTTGSSTYDFRAYMVRLTNELPQVTSSSPGAGTYSGTQSVTFTLPANATDMYYRTDGVIPTCGGAGSTHYTGAISTPSTTTYTIVACNLSNFAYSMSPANTFAYVITVADTPVVSSQTVGTLRNNLSLCAGFAFTVGGSSITATSLGRWIVSGNSGTHTLTLTDNSGTSVASCSLNTSGQTAGQYAYCAISNTTLTNGTTYRMFSQEAASGDQWYNDDSVIGTTAAVTNLGSTFGTISGANCTSPMGSGGPPASYGPVNFKYH